MATLQHFYVLPVLHVSLVAFTFLNNSTYPYLNTSLYYRCLTFHSSALYLISSGIQSVLHAPAVAPADLHDDAGARLHGKLQRPVCGWPVGDAALRQPHARHAGGVCALHADTARQPTGKTLQKYVSEGLCELIFPLPFSLNVRQ